MRTCAAWRPSRGASHSDTWGRAMTDVEWPAGRRAPAPRRARGDRRGGQRDGARRRGSATRSPRSAGSSRPWSASSASRSSRAFPVRAAVSLTPAGLPAARARRATIRARVAAAGADMAAFAAGLRGVVRARGRAEPGRRGRAGARRGPWRGRRRGAELAVEESHRPRELLDALRDGRSDLVLAPLNGDVDAGVEWDDLRRGPVRPAGRGARSPGPPRPADRAGGRRRPAGRRQGLRLAEPAGHRAGARAPRHPRRRRSCARTTGARCARPWPPASAWRSCRGCWSSRATGRAPCPSAAWLPPRRIALQRAAAREQTAAAGHRRRRRPPREPGHPRPRGGVGHVSS